MRYLINFFRERFYKGTEYTVLKPYKDVHLCVLLLSFIEWIVPIICFIRSLIKHNLLSKGMFPAYIGLLLVELLFLIVFEGQYVKISDNEIKVVELVFIKKTIKLKDIVEKEIISGGIGFRIASKDNEIIVRIFHLSKQDIEVLYKKVGYEPKHKE